MGPVGEGVAETRVPLVGDVAFANAVPVETYCSVLVIVLVMQVGVEVV